jgi:hypothetical protein
VDGRPGSPKIKDARIALNDDYLKFLRWAVWKVVEQPGGARHRIVAFVTNHGFINNRVHRGVRKALLDAFDEIHVLNLHGNQRLWVKRVVDEKGVNGTQSFTGVPLDAWTWGEGFRPLEHFLVERHGRTLDTDQIQGFQSAIHAVREFIRLGPGLDVALNSVLADPLDFGDAG